MSWKTASVFSLVEIGKPGQFQATFYFIKPHGDGKQIGQPSTNAVAGNRKPETGNQSITPPPASLYFACGFG